MRAKKAVRWECSQGELLDEAPETRTDLVKVTTDPSSDGLVTPDDVEEEVQGYHCGSCEELHEGEAEKKEGFICGECEEFYEDREDAKECCK